MSDGAAPSRTDTPNALNPGTRLGEFELLSVLGVGGFGIVYLAMDHALEREVAIKEYMPATLAGRTETMHVSIRSHSDAESFALGLKSFVNEAKLLARFDHPSLLKVYRFWEANGTAYMAMQVLRGRTIKDVRAEMGGPPDEAWLRGVLMPLLGAIERLHNEGVYHRDIAPDNIQIEPDGRPVLLDFGAARRVLSDKTQSLTAILKPAYAPIEQYGEAGSVKQGPWTDIYALGATLHYVLLRRPPAPATARALDDDHPALTVDRLPGCSERFLAIIDWMLRPRPADRPQSVAELRTVLEGRAPVPQRGQVAPRAATQPWERTDVLPPPPPPQPASLDLDVGDDATQLVGRPVAPADWSAVDLDTGAASAEHARPSVPPLELAAEREAPLPAQRSPLPIVLGGLAALGAAAYLFWPQPDAPAAVVPPPVASAPARQASSVVATGAAAVAPAAAAASDVADAAAASALAASAAAAEPIASAPPPAAPLAAGVGAESPVQTVVAPPPMARPVQKPADKPVARKEPRPAEAAKAPARPEPVPAGPGPSCGPGEGVRYHVCMGRECATAEFASHPACQRWKADAGR